MRKTNQNTDGDETGLIDWLKARYREQPIAFALTLMGLSTLTIVTGICLVVTTPPV